MSSVPSGWSSAPIGSICTLNNGRAFKPTEWVSSGLPIVRIQNLNNPKAPFNYFSGEFDERYHLKGGELLFAWSGTPGTSFGAHIWRKKEGLLNQHIFRVDFDESLLSKRFFRHAINQTLDHLIDIAHGGVGLRHVTKGKFENTEIALPPYAEQKRIADKLDSVLAHVDACRDRLDRIPALLKRFRQSILAAATSGRLTADWRTSHPARSRQAEAEVEAREEVRSTSVKVRGTSINVGNELLHDLPDSWSWVANYRLADDDSNAICAGPFGTIFKAKDFRDNGVPIIFLRHVGAGKYRTHKPNFMDQAVWRKQHQPYSVFGGELLVTKLGDPPGDACIYPVGIGTAMVTPDVMKMSVDPTVARTEYLMHYFNSPTSKEITGSVCFGVTRLRIDLSLFKTFPIPLPPIAEQHEIVRRVETLFAFADRLEARYTTARKQVEQLTPALLAKAFRGELVPQDPADEPASALLARLAAQCEAAPAPKRGRARKAG